MRPPASRPARRSSTGVLGTTSALDIELRQIRHALAVVEHGSVAAAAAQLQLSPSSLSRSLAALERQVGAALFRRSPDGLQLTDLGRVFIERGQAMVAAADELDRHIGRNRSLHAGRLVIGIGASLSEGAVASVLAPLLIETPALTFELRSALRNDLLTPLRQGELDVLIADGALFHNDQDFEVRDLPAMPLVVIARRGHPLAERPRFEMVDTFEHPVFAGGRIQPRVLDGLLQEQAKADSALARTRPMPALTSSSLAMMLRVSELTDAVTACSPVMIRSAVAAGRVVPLSAPAWLRNPYALIRPRSRAASAAADLFCHRFVAAHEAELAEARRLIAAWLPHESAGP